MKISPGKYLAIVSVVYFIIAMIDVFIVRFAPVELLQAVYVVVLSIPLWVRPVGNWIGLDN